MREDLASFAYTSRSSRGRVKTAASSSPARLLGSPARWQRWKRYHVSEQRNSDGNDVRSYRCRAALAKAASVQAHSEDSPTTAPFVVPAKAGSISAMGTGLRRCDKLFGLLLNRVSASEH